MNLSSIVLGYLTGQISFAESIQQAALAGHTNHDWILEAIEQAGNIRMRLQAASDIFTEDNLISK